MDKLYEVKKVFFIDITLNTFYHQRRSGTNFAYYTSRYMKRYILIILVLFVFAGCSTSSKVATGDSQYPGDSMSVQATTPPEPARKGKTESWKRTAPAAEKDAGLVKDDYLLPERCRCDERRR